MLFLSILCLAAALYQASRALSLGEEKRREGRLFVEDEARLRACRRRALLLSGLSLLFIFSALAGDLL